MTGSRIFAALVASAVAIGGAVVGVHQKRAGSTALALRLDGISKQVDDLAARAHALTGRWAEVAGAYHRADAEYQDAHAAFARAQRDNISGSEASKEAAANFGQAARRWGYYQALVVVAASIDAGNLDAFRSEGIEVTRSGSGEISCEPTSTARYRKVLTAAGVSLTNIDVDHIVPRSLGGADDPSNYQLLDKSLNRSLGATWNRDKCIMAGTQQCAEAVAVSRTCGWFRGPSY